MEEYGGYKISFHWQNENVETKKTDTRSKKKQIEQKIDFEAKFQHHGPIVIQITLHFHSCGVQKLHWLKVFCVTLSVSLHHIRGGTVCHREAHINASTELYSDLYHCLSLSRTQWIKHTGLGLLQSYLTNILDCYTPKVNISKKYVKKYCFSSFQ